jgi:hypothetical protein
VTGKKLALFSRYALFILAGIAAFMIWKNGGRWLDEVGRYSWNLSWGKLVVSGALMLASLSLTPSGWVMISRSMGATVPAGEMFAAWYASQLGRYIPGKIWLFAGRAGFLKANGMKTGRAAATTAYELFFTVASVGLLVIMLSVTTQSVFVYSSARTAALAAAAAILLLPLLHPVQNYLCRKKGINPGKLPSIRTSLGVTLLYSSLWAIRGYSLFLLMRGTGLAEVSFPQALAAAPLSWLAGYIVFFVPGGIGVRETIAAAIAAPGLVAPATVVIAGQRIFMAAAELLLALLNSDKVNFSSGGTDVHKG